MRRTESTRFKLSQRNLDQLLRKVFLSNSRCSQALKQIDKGHCRVSSINNFFFFFNNSLEEVVALRIDSALEEAVLVIPQGSFQVFFLDV